MPTHERFLAPVPAATYGAATISGKQPWTADYNVSCWLRGRSEPAADVSLVVRWRDASGERQLVVDRTPVARHASVLLSACVTIPAVGRIAEMTVWLLSAGSRCEVFVDELFLQRAGGREARAAVPLVAVR